MTDFGADDPFAGASGKLKEHYGIDIPVSTIRTITEKHGEAILVKQEQGSPLPKQAGVAVLITEMDGSMLPSGRNGGGLRNIDGSEKDAEIELEGSTLMFGARTGIGHAGLCGNNRWRR